MTGPPSGVPWKIFSRLDESAQHFGDTPGLGDAAARGEGRLGIEDLADRADAGLGEVGFETVEKMPCRLALVGIDLEPGVDEGADQPGPYRALVVGRVARPQITEITRLVIGLPRRQRAQSHRRQQAFANRGDDGLPARAVEDRVIERDRKDLVRSERRVVAILAIDDIV